MLELKDTIFMCVYGVTLSSGVAVDAACYYHDD